MALNSSENVKQAMLNAITPGTRDMSMVALSSTNAVVSNRVIANFSETLSGATKDLSANVTLAINSGSTVTAVAIFPADQTNYSTSNYTVEIDLTSSESFPDGGNLIVTSFAITLGDL